MSLIPKIRKKNSISFFGNSVMIFINSMTCIGMIPKIRKSLSLFSKSDMTFINLMSFMDLVPKFRQKVFISTFQHARYDLDKLNSVYRPDAKK